LTVTLFLSNLPFYDMEILKKGSFLRMRDNYSNPTLEVKLNGAEDPIIEEFTRLLSVPIQTVFTDRPSSSDLSLYDQLLRSSTIGLLIFLDLHLNDSTAPLVLSLASHAKEINVRLRYSSTPLNQQLSSSASFIDQLDSMPRLSS
ncbi:hypothetical protein PMAYCL1PPCAC_25490, partial [Pristionchus mayeri]